MLIQCSCKHCGGPIEIDHEEAERAVDCPHCMEKTFATAGPKPRGIPPVFNDDAYAIKFSYCMAFLVPFVGLLFGIYLMTRKQAGHGLACVGINIILSPAVVFIISHVLFSVTHPEP